MTGVFTSLLAAAILFGCTAIAVRVNVIGEVLKIEENAACSNAKPAGDNLKTNLLTIQVKEVLDKVNPEDVSFGPGEVIVVSGGWNLLEDLLRESAVGAKGAASVYMELEAAQDAAPDCWYLSEDSKALVLPGKLSDLPSSQPARSRRQTNTGPVSGTCCIYGLNHFLANKHERSWCQKLTYPPQYQAPSCQNGASICCQCCQLGHTFRNRFGTRICNLAPRLGYSGSCLAMFQQCCLDEVKDEPVEITINHNGSCVANGSLTSFDRPNQRKWDVMSKPGYGETGPMLTLINIIESWAGATEILIEPNGDRVSNNIFTATLDVTFQNGQKVHVDYTRVPDEGSSNEYSIVVDITGSVPESFLGLSQFTTILLSSDISKRLTTVHGIGSRDTLPKGMKVAMSAVFKTGASFFKPSKLAQLDIYDALITRSTSKVKITTTSTISAAQEKVCQNGFLNRYRECECCEGWRGDLCEIPVCANCEDDSCPDYGEDCECYRGYKGHYCNETLCRRRDIVFVLDMSISLTSTDFRVVKEFVSDFMRQNRPSMGACKTRYAIIKYGYDVETEFDFTHSQQAAAIIRATQRMSRVKKNRGTRTTQALREALAMLQDQGRTGIDWTIILVSDGKSTDDKKNALQKIIKQMNANNIHRLSIGVGLDFLSGVRNELDRITSEGWEPVLVQDFAELTSKAESASRFICSDP